MKTKNIILFFLIAVLLGAALFVVNRAYGQDDQPGGVFYLEDCGLVCIEWADGSGDCYPCLTCQECDECDEPGPNPTPEPTPPPDPTPEPTEKPKCNRGLGNDSEGCDPGNSGGKPGSAGEDNE